jgi:hypothetical protein
MKRRISMKNKVKLLASMVLVMIVAFSATLVSAQDWEYATSSGTSSGTNVVNAPEGTPEACYLYGSVTVVGSAATWTSFLSGEYRYLCTAACSFCLDLIESFKEKNLTT